MRANQRVLVGVVNAFANSVAGHECEVGAVFRLDRSLRSAQLGLIAAATRAKTLMGVNGRRRRLSKRSGHSSQVGSRQEAEGLYSSVCFSGGLLSS